MRRLAVPLVFLAGVTVGVLLYITGATSSPKVTPTSESLTLDQAQPVSWGESLSFTAVYTTAEKKSNPPRIYNPTVAVECAGWRSAAWLGHGQTKETNLGGGWWTADFPVGAPVGFGAARCDAWLEFTDSKGNTTILASTQFPID